jgi:hypothetical protein
MIKRLFYTFLILFAVPLVWAKDYYIDPGCTYNGDGSFNSRSCAAGAGQAGPYNTWSGLSPSGGDDYRQGCRESYTRTLSITGTGSVSDYIIIGS